MKKKKDRKQSLEKMLKSDIRKRKICDIVGIICVVLFLALLACGFIMITLAIFVNLGFILIMVLSFLLSYMFGHFIQTITRKMSVYYQSIRYIENELNIVNQICSSEEYLYDDFAERIRERMG